MEITLLEDPACGWCWAFQPVTTALQFELPLGHHPRRSIKLRRVMGGLSDRPVIEGSFIARSWEQAARISGMPFNTAIWDRHLLRTTFEACRAVKAALGLGQNAGHRLLRRLRESFFVGGIPIDSRENIIDIARQEGINTEEFLENLANGRSDFLFERDRQEALPYRFGFPTVLIRKHLNDAPIALHGVVGYGEVLHALFRSGLSPGDRARFQDRPDDWDRLFSIHSRLTLAEVRAVTGLDGEALAQCLARNGIRRDGAFLVRAPRAPEPIPPSAAEARSAPEVPQPSSEAVPEGLGSAPQEPEVGGVALVN